jgi:ABC-type bacteriocin/lantibiotic exporter with double-glycine peptidase domain
MAIAWREGLSASGGVIGLLIVFATMAFVAAQERDDVELLIALAVTLPRQIEMTSAVHQFVSGWNDVLAHWTRWGGIIANMRPNIDPNFEARIRFDRLILHEGQQVQECSTVEDALRLLLAQPTGRISLRGGNASGKSTLLAALKSRLKKHSYYWPQGDRLSFAFARSALLAEAGYGDEEENEHGVKSNSGKRLGYSSGERMLKALQEIVNYTDDAIYLFDEWDANLDPTNRAEADKLVNNLAARARVIEISHRDKELMLPH